VLFDIRLIRRWVVAEDCLGSRGVHLLPQRVDVAAGVGRGRGMVLTKAFLEFAWGMRSLRDLVFDEQPDLLVDRRLVLVKLQCSRHSNYLQSSLRFWGIGSIPQPQFGVPVFHGSELGYGL